MSSPIPPPGPDGYGSPGPSHSQPPQYPGAQQPQPPMQPPGPQQPYATPGGQNSPAAGSSFGATPPPGGPGDGKKKIWPWIVGGCGCLVVIAVLVIGAVFVFGGGFGLFGSGDDPDPPAASEPSEPDDPDTSEPESDEPDIDDPVPDAPGGGSSEDVEGSGELTDADLEPAKEVVIAYLDAVVTGEYEEACRYIYDESTGGGFDADNPLADVCVSIAEDSAEETEDLSGIAGTLRPDDLDAEIDGTGITVSPKGDDTTTLQVVKGSDGELYVAG